MTLQRDEQNINFLPAEAFQFIRRRPPTAKVLQNLTVDFKLPAQNLTDRILLVISIFSPFVLWVYSEIYIIPGLTVTQWIIFYLSQDKK